MVKKKTHTEEEKPKRATLFGQIISGSFLTKDWAIEQMPYLFFVLLISIFYIGYGYQAEKTVRELYKVEKELKELKSEYTTTSSELEVMRQQSSVAARIEESGLKESRIPPKKIVVEKGLLED